MFITILTFIIILGLLVLVHELGHFIVARRFGVKCEEFGLGFPPRMIGIVRKSWPERIQKIKFFEKWKIVIAKRKKEKIKKQDQYPLQYQEEIYECYKQVIRHQVEVELIH